MVKMKPMDRTPVSHEVLGNMLVETKYDPKKTGYLVQGFKVGFKLRLDCSITHIARAQRKAKGWKQPKNHQSALSHPKTVEEKLRKEILANRMIGPFLKPIYKDFCVSPLGLRKKKELNKFRIIHDLSAPYSDNSVNNHIPTEAATVSYHSVETAIRLIRDIGLGAVLCKTDIEYAYKLVPIHEDDIPALGIKWLEDWL